MKKPRMAKTLSKGKQGDFYFCCLDADVINVFRLDVAEDV